VPQIAIIARAKKQIAVLTKINILPFCTSRPMATAPRRPVCTLYNFIISNMDALHPIEPLAVRLTVAPTF